MIEHRAVDDGRQELPGLSCGTDLVEIASFVRYIEVGGERFLRRIFTERELEHCGGRTPRLAARFAAKEAVAKALGTGIRGIDWTEMEIRNDPRGRPSLRLHGRAAKRATELRLSGWAISLSHSEMFALAFVIAFAKGDQGQRDSVVEQSSEEQVAGLFPDLASIFEARLLALGDAMARGGEATLQRDIEKEPLEGQAGNAGDTKHGRSSQ